MSNREAAAASERPLPPLPEWAKCDDLGGLVPSEIRQALRAYVLADRAASAPQAVRFLTEDEVLGCFQPHWAKIDAAPNIQRKFCEVNGIVPLAPQDSTKEGT